MANIDDQDQQKIPKCWKQCEENIQKIWRDEYLKGLRERHQIITRNKDNNQHIGVLVKAEKCNKSFWKIGIV